jgi:hypothetical protein
MFRTLPYESEFDVFLRRSKAKQTSRQRHIRACEKRIEKEEFAMLVCESDMKLLTDDYARMKKTLDEEKKKWFELKSFQDKESHASLIATLKKKVEKCEAKMIAAQTMHESHVKSSKDKIVAEHKTMLNYFDKEDTVMTTIKRNRDDYDTEVLPAVPPLISDEESEPVQAKSNQLSLKEKKRAKLLAQLAELDA